VAITCKGNEKEQDNEAGRMGKQAGTSTRSEREQGFQLAQTGKGQEQKQGQTPEMPQVQSIHI
jgi:hypothetical protein